RAQGMNEKQSEKLSQDAEFIEGLQGSDQNSPGQDHQAMYNYVHQGLDSGQTTQLSDAWAELVSGLDEFEGDCDDSVQKSHHHWEAESADSARSYMQSLGQWSKGNSQQAQLASEAIYAQSNAAETAKNSMPEPVETNGLMKDFGSAVKENPLNPIGAFNQAMETREKADAAHQEAAPAMSTYDKNLYESASKQPAFAPPPEFGGAGGGDGSVFKGSGVIDIPGGPSDSTSAAGYSGGPSGGPSVPGGGGPGTVSNLPGGGGGNSPGVVPTPTPMPGRSTGQGQMPGAGPAANTPAARMPTTGAGPGGFGGMGPVGPIAGGAAAGGSTPYSSKLGRPASAGGFGPTGSGSGSAAGAAKGMGAGAAGAAGGAAGAGSASGAAKPGMGGAAPGAAAAAGGAGGRGGAGGGMMGGAGAGRGQQGGEDEEHQRPSWLVEADPESLFGTDERTAPPVIGE